MRLVPQSRWYAWRALALGVAVLGCVGCGAAAESVAGPGTIQLLGGRTVTGRLSDGTFSLRTAYGDLELSNRWVLDLQ